ncbi:glycosyltransferase family 2 protein [Pontiella sp.]|uniref:glycosyltransferase family 2 protein n=1 Tax=Pontiella sp. TaxID=2837462 RepID=UPI0035625BFA
MPSVSIYIITYLNSEERGQVLLRTCEQAFLQRYPDFEVVVSDNGGSYAAADALASIDDPRLKVCTNKENEGFTGNINRCLEHCSFDIIKLLCDDDLIHPDFLAATVPLVDDHTLIVVGVRKFLFGDDPKELNTPISMPAPWETRNPGYGHDIWHLPYVCSCIPSATLLTRALFKELGGFDRNTITADWDFFVEACLNAKVVHVQTTLCFVGVWGGSLTEEMAGTPYFFPRESLYTKFRFLHCKSLPLNHQVRILAMVFKELLWQGLRPFRHPFSKTYWSGFFDYVRYQTRLTFMKKRQFGERPMNP